MLFAFAILIATVIQTGTWFLTVYFRRLAFAYTLLVFGCYFAFVQVDDRWTWFTWAKHVSVMIPAILYAYTHMTSSSGKKIVTVAERLWPWLLGLNMLEAGLVGLQFAQGRWELIVNGASMVILALMVPRREAWQLGKLNLFGFKDQLWIAANTFALGYFYLFNPEFGGLTVAAIIAIILPQLAVFIYRDSRVWFSARIYCVLVAVWVKAYFPKINNAYLYPSWINKKTVLFPLLSGVTSRTLLFFQVAALLIFLWSRWTTATRRPVGKRGQSR